jgi:hypothetical protein
MNIIPNTPHDFYVIFLFFVIATAGYAVGRWRR